MIRNQYNQQYSANGCGCQSQTNGCSCSTNTNGILETFLGQPDKPITVVGFELTTQSALILGAVVVVAGIIIKKV